MASAKLLFLLVVASIFVATVYSDESVSDFGKGLVEDVQKKIDEKTEPKGFFSSLGDKVGHYYDTAVEKGKDAAKKAGEVISTSYDKLKEKAKDLMDSSEKTAKETTGQKK